MLLLLDKFSQVVRVDELASLAVGAIPLVVVLLAKLGLVHRWNVYFFHEFVFSMGKSTVVTVLASLSLFEALAQLGLLLDLVVSSQDSSVVSEGKWILL